MFPFEHLVQKGERNIPDVTNDWQNTCNHVHNVEQVNYFSQEEMKTLLYYGIAEKIRASSKMQQVNLEYDRKENLKRLEADLKERTLERKEVLRLKRELVSYEIFEDSEGYLCKIQISAEGRPIGGKRFCNVRHLRMQKYYCEYEKGAVYKITWDESVEGNEIFIMQDELNADVLSSHFTKAGIALHAAREYKRSLIDLVIVHLLKYVENIEIPPKWGWNKMKSGWYWCGDKENLQEVILEKCQ